MRTLILFFCACFITANLSAQEKYVTTKEGCKILVGAAYKEGMVMSWSGPCINGYASGKGVRRSFYNDTLMAQYEGE